MAYVVASQSRYYDSNPNHKKRCNTLFNFEEEQDSFCGIYFGKGRIHTKRIKNEIYMFARKDGVIYCTTNNKDLIAPPIEIERMFQ
jgi:hypothetical protein